MKKILLLLFLLLAFFLNDIYAIPAYPRNVKMNINGTVCTVRLFGDEYFKRVETEEGYTIVEDDNGQWYYAILNSTGQLTYSAYKVGAKSEKERSFISELPLHLANNVERINSKTFERAKTIKRTTWQPVIGQRRMLIILMEFPDQKFTKTEEDFDNLFNQIGYKDDDAQGSVRDFFYRSSYGQMVLSCDIYGPYESAKTMRNYGGNSILGGGDKDPMALFEEAIKNVATETDLRMYDGDEDGYVDNVHIVFAGYGEEAGARSDAIWSHEVTFTKPYELQGLKIDRYSCAPELRGNSGNGISRIGPHCHEIGHALGAMDYYDADYDDGGQYLGTGDWDLMASGSWNNEGITPADVNPYVKAYCYGWIEPHFLPKGEVRLEPSDEDGNSYYVIRNGNEMYLLENRNPQSFNDGLPGSGLLIFHVHADLENVYNDINITHPQMCYVVCASSKIDVPGATSRDYGSINSEGCPYPGTSFNTLFSAASTPRAFWWNSEPCNIEISQIRLESDGCIYLTNASVDLELQSTEKTEILFEGFEGDSKYTLLSSEKSSWEKVKKSDYLDKVLGRPTSYEGNYSLQLSAKNNVTGSRSTIGLDCQHSVEATSLQISGYLTSKGLNNRMSNLVRVGWGTSESDITEWHELDISVNNVWTPFTLNVDPHNTYIAIEGVAHTGSIIAIDNLSIKQLITNGVKPLQCGVLNIESAGYQIFSINGTKQPHIQKGLNLIRLKDGTVRKFFAK